MPYLAFNTNVEIPDAKAESLLKALSAGLAKGTGKPESVVQVELSGGGRMLMNKTAEPTAYMDVKAIGLPESAARDTSALLTEIAVRELGVPANRVYIAFASYQGAMWGVNGTTFS